MKLLLIALMLTMAHAFAAEVKIYEGPDKYGTNTSIYYDVNAQTGYAGVKLLIKKESNDHTFRNTINVNVPGLSVVGSSVVYNDQGQQVECATVGRHTVRATGNCSFRTVTTRTGWNRSMTIYLVTK